MSPERKFYVYAHYRKSDGRIFYIGKGCRSRYKSRYGRNQRWLSIVEKHDFKARKIRKAIPEACAFSLEKALIFINRKKLCNLSSGGGGGTGIRHSAEWIEKTAAAHRGAKRGAATKKRLSLAAKERLSDPRNHPRTKTSTGNWWNENGDVFFGDHIALSEAYGLSIESVKKVQSGGLFSHKGWKLAGVRNYSLKSGARSKKFCSKVRIWEKKGEPNMIGTRNDFAAAKNINSNSLYSVCHGVTQTAYGWTCRDL